jgi:hypothetical protein
MERFGQRIVRGIPRRSKRGDDSCFGQTLGGANGQVLDPVVGVVDEPIQTSSSSCPDGHLQGIECQLGLE